MTPLFSVSIESQNVKTTTNLMEGSKGGLGRLTSQLDLSNSVRKATVTKTEEEGRDYSMTFS
jgi:hypothetical protein